MVSCGPNLAKSCNNKHSLIVLSGLVKTRSICVTFYFALKESPHTFSAFITFLDETHNLLLCYKLKPKKHLSCSLTLLSFSLMAMASLTTSSSIALLNKSLLPNRSSSLSSSTSHSRLYRFSSSVRSRFTSASIRAVALEPVSSFSLSLKRLKKRTLSVSIILVIFFQELNETPSSDIKETETVETQVFACPVCYEPLMRKGPSGINL